MEEATAAATGFLPGIPGKRCAHCNTQTTPLWRNGPDGPKTLCNACGVRDNRRHAKVREHTRTRTKGKKKRFLSQKATIRKVQQTFAVKKKEYAKKPDWLACVVGVAGDNARA